MTVDEEIQQLEAKIDAITARLKDIDDDIDAWRERRMLINRRSELERRTGRTRRGMQTFRQIALGIARSDLAKAHDRGCITDAEVEDYRVRYPWLRGA